MLTDLSHNYAVDLDEIIGIQESDHIVFLKNNVSFKIYSSEAFKVLFDKLKEKKLME